MSYTINIFCEFQELVYFKIRVLLKVFELNKDDTVSLSENIWVVIRNIIYLKI